MTIKTVAPVIRNDHTKVIRLRGDIISALRLISQNNIGLAIKLLNQSLYETHDPTPNAPPSQLEAHR